MKAKLIKTDGQVIDITPVDGVEFQLEELQNYVGGYIEAVQVGKGFLYVNEEGKLIGLPFNKVASDLTNGKHVIVGNAVLTDH